MEPNLHDALKVKYQALQADFGSKAAERLREVVDHAIAQLTGGAHARPAQDGAATSKKSRAWSPAQRAEQKRKMQAYWAAKRKGEGSKGK